MEDLFHATRDDTSLRVTGIVLKTFHCMCLACARLSVGQNGSVISLQHRDDRLLGGVFVNEFLRAAFIVHIVKAEVLPDTQVWIQIHIFLALFFGHLST